MKQSGVTLLELIVVLGISAILLGIGIPSFAAFASNSRLASATNSMVATLHLARSEAIKRNSRVVMCTSSTGTACVASGGWHQGWLVFHDINNNAWLDEGETLILSHPGMPEGLRLRGNSHVASYISYTPTGAAKLISGAFQVGTIKVCSASESSGSARQIIISSSGRPRTAKATLASCP